MLRLWRTSGTKSETHGTISLYSAHFLPWLTNASIVRINVILDSLPVVKEAHFDSYDDQQHSHCLQGTRTELLKQIFAWANDRDSKTVYWLNGMAGTGKSTISRTVAQDASNRGQLGASFFFKRGESDRGRLQKLVTTIAADLVARQPDIAIHVQKSLEENPHIVGKATREQFDELIFQPLKRFCLEQSAHRGLPIIVVVDALDECDNDDGFEIELLVGLFSNLQKLQPPLIKVFCTSRPEVSARDSFKRIDGFYEQFILHEMRQLEVKDDISRYLEHELLEVQKSYNRNASSNDHLPQHWPGQSTIESLAVMASPLFIFAATVCRFLKDKRCGHPVDLLEEVMLYKTSSQVGCLDATYLPVLRLQIKGLDAATANKVTESFRYIVGSVVILASPLSTDTLAQILHLKKTQVQTRLDPLHSVLSVPEDAGSHVRLLHLSFRDFILDPAKKGTSPFWVDSNEAHHNMFINCLKTMERLLKQDICELKRPGTLRSDVKISTIEAFIPPELRYSCEYWVYHLQSTDPSMIDSVKVGRFIARHFLHWLEALSLLNKARESLKLIKKLNTYFEVSQTQCIIVVDILTNHAKACRQ